MQSTGDAMKIARGGQCAVGVVGKKRRYLERNPAVDLIRLHEGGLEEIGRSL